MQTIQTMQEILEREVSKPTTFGCGREDFKKVVCSQNNRNYGDPHNSSLPGPGYYEYVEDEDIGPVSGENYLKTMKTMSPRGNAT